MFRHPATLTGWPSRGVPDLLCGWRDSTPESHAISRACWRSEFELELRSDMTAGCAKPTRFESAFEISFAA